MNTHHFENLEVWKRGCRLAVDVCKATSEFKIYTLRDQIQKSAISIPSNIAEGSEKPTTPDFLRFLGYSKGSSGELRTQLMIYKALSQEMNIPLPDNLSNMINETLEISRMLQGLTTHLSTQASNPSDQPKS